MTTWVENPRGGRERGPRGLVRAWVEVLVRPRRFFRNGVAPGDQAPGLAFGVAVALAYLAGLLGSGAATVPSDLPVVGGTGALATAFVVLAVVLVVAPAALHLTAALQTLLLMLVVPDRAGVSETVQVVAYATAPCALAGLPVPGLRVLCTGYGAALLVVGLSEVHGASPGRAAVAGAVPAALVFGYGFGGFGAIATLLRAWYVL
ncbi:MAG: YIP1 family protein [Haloferacaceae archaeon]